MIRDILHRLADRCPTHVLVWPVPVQGEAAAGQVAAAIRGFGAMANPPDLIIVARGGGSIEDLWAFNEEVVVRAAAESPIPLISAVGHETDTTLIDFAADRRAPTPTAAAEMAVPVRPSSRRCSTIAGARMRSSLALQAGRAGERLGAVAARWPEAARLFEPARGTLGELGGAAAARAGARGRRMPGPTLGRWRRDCARRWSSSGSSAAREQLDVAVAAGGAGPSRAAAAARVRPGHRPRTARPSSTPATRARRRRCSLRFADGSVDATVDGASCDGLSGRRQDRIGRPSPRAARTPQPGLFDD